MNQPYFLRVASQTPTGFWVNNPTRAHSELAIANGATGSPTNPSLSQRMVDYPPEAPVCLACQSDSANCRPPHIAIRRTCRA